MKQKDFIVSLLALFVSLSVYAQQVSGTITDDSSQPLSGVSIIVKGTTTGAISDFDGNYSISADSGATLIFSYVGFDTVEKVVTGATLDVRMVSGLSLGEVVLIGTRNPSRTAINSAVPVDVLDISGIVESSPQIAVTEILNYAAPSFSSNTQTISDGTDHIAPASLRGLGPDQVLVLINGKRRHKTSLVNVNGTFGRGSVGTDLDVIPVNAIDRIEILRDGAAAQYGSDAIAGVINIVLKKSTNQLDIGITSGANFTSENPDDSVDGEKINVGANYGLPIGDNGGFINFTGNFDFRGATNRMKEWEGTIFNFYNTVERFAAADGYDLSDLLDDDVEDVIFYGNQGGLNLPLDATKDELRTILGEDNTTAELAARGLQRSDFNMRVGQSEVRGGQFFGNFELPVGEDLDIYAFGGLGFKNGNSAGFYRLPNQSRAYTPARINGFLPEINSNIKDKSIAVGIKGKLGDWNVDLSNTTGQNQFRYRIGNSLNASLGNSTPFEADAGGFNYLENTSNLDTSKFLEDVLSGLNIAFGAEYRVENYSIVAGEEASYAQYDNSGKVNDTYDDIVRDDNGDPVLDKDGNTIANPNSDLLVPTDFFGSSRPGGIQVFPGFKPENEIDAFRTSVAGYVDVEADFSDSFRATAAARYENFSDFGGTLNGKVSFLAKASDNFNIRGSAQSGFRAPSLHQIHFNSTSTIFVDGVPNEVGIFPNTSRVARILGIEELKEETSVGFTAGFTAQVPDANLTFTVDGYLVNIDDRVVLSGQFDDNGNAELAALFAQANASQAAFFTNSVDTETKGIDFVVENRMNVGTDMKLKNTLSFTYSKTEVAGTNIPSAIVDAGLSETFFDRTSRIYIESAVPNTQGTLSNNLTIDDHWSVFLRNSYFGEVEEATNNTDADVDRLYAGKVVTDLSVAHRFGDGVKLTVGANNLLDVYPDEADDAFRSSGRFIYSRRSKQFGVGGRFLFARFSITIE
ncbi:MAG: TonB-dependent receptor [Flavobacteriaceae bacterium]|nr:TonB-dependent receptor [Flavobacteriaceae bacterium]